MAEPETPPLTLQQAVQLLGLDAPGSPMPTPEVLDTVSRQFPRLAAARREYVPKLMAIGGLMVASDAERKD